MKAMEYHQVRALTDELMTEQMYENEVANFTIKTINEIGVTFIDLVRELGNSEFVLHYRSISRIIVFIFNLIRCHSKKLFEFLSS